MEFLKRKFFPHRTVVDVLAPHRILVDISNVVGAMNDGTCSLELYFNLQKKLNTVFRTPQIYGVADYRLKNHINRRYEYFELLKSGQCVQAFDGVPADDLILGIFLKYHQERPGYVWVVSNDGFGDHRLSGDLREYLIRFRIVDGKIRLYNGKLSHQPPRSWDSMNRGLSTQSLPSSFPFSFFLPNGNPNLFIFFNENEVYYIETVAGGFIESIRVMGFKIRSCSWESSSGASPWRSSTKRPARLSSVSRRRNWITPNSASASTPTSFRAATRACGSSRATSGGSS